MEIQIAGKVYKAKVEQDLCQMIPWKEWDCHGIVYEWMRRPKRPGEMILYSDRHEKTYYDFAETVKIARAVWGAKSRKEAAELAMADFERLRKWCNDQWQYVTLIVEDENGDTESIGGLESDDQAGIKHYAKYLAIQLYEREFGPQPDLFGE
jgi:hypothetical protein